MTVSEKIKTINNKIEQNKTQYNLDRQTAKSLALSSENVDKYEFLKGENILPEKQLLEKAAKMKRFEYSPLGSEMKKQTSISKDQYQGLDKVHEFSKKIIYETKNKKGIKSNLFYSNNLLFRNTAILKNFLILFLLQNKKI